MAWSGQVCRHIPNFDRLVASQLEHSVLPRIKSSIYPIDTIMYLNIFNLKDRVFV